MVIADEIILRRGVGQIHRVLHRGDGVDAVAVDVHTRRVADMHSCEILRVGGGVLLDVVMGNHAVGVGGLDAAVARGDVAAVDDQVIALVVGADVVEAEVAAGDGTLAERDGVTRELGDSRGTAHRAAVGIRGVDVLGIDDTTVERDVLAAVAAHHHATRNVGVLGLERQVLEYEVLDIHQRHRTVGGCTDIGTVVDDNDALRVVTLEGDGVGRRLPDVVLVEVESRVGAGPQVEDRRAAEAAVVQRLLDGGYVGEIGVGATHRIVALQQAVAGVRRYLDGVVLVIAVHRPVTGVHIDGHIVVAVCGSERAEGE